MAERLIGSDGKLVTTTYGNLIEGPGTAPADGWYEVVAKATVSDLPSGAVVGKLVYLEEDDDLADGDDVKQLIETEQADVTAFSMQMSRAEVDVTTLSDRVRRYRAGKVDMQGSLEGITSIGNTDAAGWVLNNFIDIVKQSESGIAIEQVDDSPIFIKGYVQKEETFGENEAFIFARIIMLSSELGASGEDAQNFSSSFRIAAGDPDPTYYVRELGEVS